VLRDLTARWQAEQALRESEARFRGTFENAAVGIAHVGLDGHWLRVNDRLCEITGYSHEELLMRTFQDITHPDDLEADLTSVRQVLAGEIATYAMEKRYLRKDGGIVWVTLTVSLVRKPSGKPDYFISVVEDITPRKQAEEALREREERYALVVGGAEAAIWDWHVPAQRVVFSPRWKELRGLSDAEVSDREEEWSSRIHPDDSERVMAAVRAHFEGRTPVFAEEYRVRHKDGRWIWILDRGIARRDAAGQVLRMAGSETDITERKSAEEALRTSEERYRATFVGAPVGIAHVGLDGRFLRFNEAVCTITGYPREELETLTFSDITHPDDLEADWAHVRRMRTGEIDTYAMEKRYLRKDGAAVWVNLTVSLLRTEAGEPLHFISVIENITERKQAEGMRQHLAAIIESSDDAIISKSLEGVITSWNRGAEQLYGYRADEVLGKPIAMLIPSDRADELATILERLKRGEPLDHYETQRLHKNGTRLDVSLTISPMRDASGRVVGASAIARDITERKHAEHERHRLEAQLRQAQKLEAIGTLAGGIAHEFNNILAGLLGFATLLHREVPSDSRAGFYVQQVRQAGQRAKELVEQIITFSRAEPSSHEPLQLDQVVQEALTLLRASLPTTIDIQYRHRDPEAMVHANRTQLHEIILNLGANADYAMRSTGGRMTIDIDTIEVDAAFASAHPPLHPGPHVRLTMADTGGGMAPEVMARLFEPFFTTKASGEGAGMGLAIVHGIVTSHRGAITVASTRGVGTRFAFYLPRIEASMVQATAPAPPLPQGQECVLLVDDEEVVALAMRLLLESLGYDVVVHTTSRDALTAFRTEAHRFDVVITDQTMPQMTGEGLIHALRRIRPDIPVILCTGFSHVMDAEKAQGLGRVAFLMKPVDERELAVTLQQVLGRRPARTR
jgi:PAS domain S-box-containing protein